MSDDMVADVQAGMVFAVKFAPAIVKLKKAKDSGLGCQLTKDEVEGVIEALQLLRSR